MVDLAINQDAIESISSSNDERAVSQLSAYSDIIWDFNLENQNKALKKSASQMKFDRKLPNGSRLNEDSNVKLLDNFKSALCVLFRKVQKKGNLPSAATKKNIYGDLWAFVCFLNERQIEEFQDTLAEDFSAYRTFLLNSDFCNNTKYIRMQVLCDLFRLRGKLDFQFSVDPMGGMESFDFFIGGRRTKALGPYKYQSIPDEVAKDLVKKSVDLLDNCESLLKVERELRDPLIFSPSKRGGTSKSAKERARRRIVNNYGFCSYNQVVSEIGFLKDACFIVISFFTGMRISEISSLLIDCVVQDEDGSYSVNGTKIKMGVMSANWICPPIVKKASDIAAQLSEHSRMCLSDERAWLESKIKEEGDDVKNKRSNRLIEIDHIGESIWLTPANQGGRGRPSEYGSYITSFTGFNARLKKFILAKDILKYQGKVWNLHPHQFRHTYAKFMAANLMNLRYLKEHFKHKSLAMTAWYGSDDIEMNQMIFESIFELRGTLLRDVISTGAIMGKGGDAIKGNAREIFLGLVSDEERDDFIADLSNEVIYKSTGHSGCLGNADKALCSGVTGCMFDPRNVLICENAFVTPENIPDWEFNKERCLAAIDDDGLGEPAKEIERDLLNNTIQPILDELYDMVKAVE